MEFFVLRWEYVNFSIEIEDFETVKFMCHKIVET